MPGREAQQQEPSGYVTLADATLVGMQALNAAYGAQSPQAQAAWALQALVMEQARLALLGAHDDKCAPVLLCRQSTWRPRIPLTPTSGAGL